MDRRDGAATTHRATTYPGAINSQRAGRINSVAQSERRGHRRREINHGEGDDESSIIHHHELWCQLSLARPVVYEKE
jgi:hypothetical protein